MPSVSREQRFHKSNPCPLCAGYDEMSRGKGQRCSGFMSADGLYIHCGREEYAHGLPMEEGGTYAHKRTGRCACGHSHRETTPQTKSVEEAVYPYHDEQWRVLYEAVRYVPKQFKQRRITAKGPVWDMKGVRYVLYRLPEVLEAISLGKLICLTEGEKDADRLRARGYTATTNIAGAGKWRPEYTEQLRGAERAILFPHNDLVGREHMGKVANELRGAGIPVFHAEMSGLPDKGDIADWLQAHPAQEALDRLIADASPILTDTEIQERTFPALDSISYTLADLQRRTIPDLVEVIPGKLHEGFGIIAGPSGTGKSYLCLQIGLAVALEQLCLGQWPTIKGDVLYLGTEDNQRRIDSRVRQLWDEEDMPRWPDNFTVVHTPQALNDGLQEQLSEWLTTHPLARLIMIDMFADVRPARRPNGDWYTEDRALGKILAHLAVAHHVCILATMHTNRLKQSEDPFERVHGGDGLLGSCDIKTVLLPSATQGQSVWSLKGRDIDRQAYTLRQVDGTWIYEGDASMADASDERRAILHYFQTWPGAHRPDEVARTLGKSVNAITLLMRKMAKTGALRKVGYGQYQLGSSGL
jgi:hypothetical protein